MSMNQSTTTTTTASGKFGTESPGVDTEHSHSPQGRPAIGSTATTRVAAPVDAPRFHANYATCNTAPGEARHDVTHVLGSWGLERLAETARLLVSELVTNVVAHANSRRVGVVVTRIAETIARIMVLDDDRTEMLLEATPSGDEESGRGLILVAALSNRWGIEYVPTGKRIWCELDVPVEKP